MAASQAAYAVEKAIGHDGSSITQQDVANYGKADAGEGAETMLALTWQGKNTVKVVTTAKPRLLEDGDAILKVTGSTVCGSDLHLLDGTVVQMNKGDILGHEFCGIIESVAPGVKRVQPGKRYVASFQIACGDCFFCKQKLSSQCEKTNSNSSAKAMYGAQTAGMFGYSHFTGGFAGGQAEYVRIPLADVNLLEIPDNVPDEKALFLSDILPTAFNCVKDTAVYENDAVAIFGAGPIGQLAGIFSLAEGARKIIFVDTEPRLSETKARFKAADQSKIELIDFKKLSFGATNKETVVSKLKDLCDGRGPDVALECAAGEYPKGWLHTIEIALGAETDTSEILNEMIESVRNYGRVGVTGVYVGYTNHLNIGSLMQRGIRLIGNGQAPVHKYWDYLLKQIVDEKLDPLEVVSHRVRIDDLEIVYDKFKNHEDQMQKVYVETKFSQPRAQGTPELTVYGS